MVTENSNQTYNLYFTDQRGKRHAAMVESDLPAARARERARLWVVSMNATARAILYTLGAWESGRDDYGVYESAAVTVQGGEVVGVFTAREKRGVN